MLRPPFALMFLSLLAFNIQAKTTTAPNSTSPTISKVKIAQNFHTCFKDAWNLQWQNYCVTEATKQYKRLIPKSQQPHFKAQIKSCATKFGDVVTLDPANNWKVYECEMQLAEKFAR